MAQELSVHYDKVIGLDPSQSMLASAYQARTITRAFDFDIVSQACAAANIEYRVSSAEEMAAVEARSVDLIAVAQAAQCGSIDYDLYIPAFFRSQLTFDVCSWFDIPAFIKECNRVLKPSGTLGICRCLCFFFLLPD